MDDYISINKIAELKGLKSTRSIRLEINQGQYIAREVEVRGGKSYEILYSSLEPDIQDRLDEEELKTTAIVPFRGNLYTWKSPETTPLHIFSILLFESQHFSNTAQIYNHLRKSVPSHSCWNLPDKG